MYCRQLLQIRIVSSIYVTCFGLLDYPQALKYSTSTAKIKCIYILCLGGPKNLPILTKILKVVFVDGSKVKQSHYKP